MDQKSKKESRWLRSVREDLEHRAQELTNKLDEVPRKKKHGKQSSNDRAEKLERIKTINIHLEKVKYLQKVAEGENGVSELLWDDLYKYLYNLLDNLDSPDYIQQLNFLYQKVEQFNSQIKRSLSQKRDNKERMKELTQKWQFKPLESIGNIQSLLNPDQNTQPYKLKMMDISLKNMPQVTDYFPPSQQKEKVNLKSLFPKYKMISQQILHRLENETLYYIFYYSKESQEQYLAAREIRNRQWQFYNKFNIWVKKADAKGQYEETDQVIKGPFLYFDFEKQWIQKKKPDFKLKLKYLDSQLEFMMKNVV